PDFTFDIAGQAQGSLKQQGSNEATLLVLYTLPVSLSRLGALATERDRLRAHGARVIAIAIDGRLPDADGQEAAPIESICAITGPDVAVAYALFTQRAGEADPSVM